MAAPCLLKLTDGIWEDLVNRWRMISRALSVILLAALVVSTLLPSAGRISAQGTTTLVLSVPAVWEDLLTADLLAQFEARYPGVTVALILNDTSFFGLGQVAGTIDERLDSTEALVSTADVMYIDSSSLTPEGTQAGYFLDLQPLVMNDPAMNPADFVPATWQSYQWDNGTWALPLSTDVIVLTYDPVAFDEVGLAYPNERWTIDDFANAARRLAQYNADGTVLTPGLSTVSGGNNQDLFLRTLLNSSLYDTSAPSSTPALTSPELEYTLQLWYELRNEGVVLAQGGGRNTAIPLRVEGINGYAQRGFGRQQEVEETRYAALLPGGVAGLAVQGFAVSAGTQYPELAYALAAFLTERAELATNNFSVYPARYSLMNVAAQADTSANVPGGGAGGGPGTGGGAINRSIPDEIRPTIDQGLIVGLPVSEVRYASYLSAALTEMNANGGDALSALQVVEARAISDAQTALARKDTTAVFITPPVTASVLAAGEISLTCAVSLGFGGRMGGGGQLSNQDLWDQVVADFVMSDPQVGAVTLENVPNADLAALAQDYDCIILSSNAVPDTDLSVVLNLDPLLGADPTFDRNEIIGNTLAQLQQDNKIWALPLAIQPQMLQYNPEMLAWAGVPEPVSGWTADSFTDALRMLKLYDTDPAPFAPADPSGSYLLMLITAYGGLPLDYRTDPPTVNFTDPVTVGAIRQVLDLASAGYISYSALAQDAVTFSSVTDAAITTNTLNQFQGARLGGSATTTQTNWTLALYPRGSQYNALAYEITTGYISATSQSPEAAYRFLSLVARNPQLFTGMPVRQSLVNDPAVVATQGSEMAAVYQQLDALLRSPDTIIFPTFTQGRGSVTRLVENTWLYRAFDSYVLTGTDLEQALADAQLTTLAYQDCVAGIVVDPGSAPDATFQMGQLMLECAASVDPSLAAGF